jgi:predicted Abi (CAAX) family protease
MRVQHYNPVSQQFDGAQEVIRIPQQPPDQTGVYNMTTRELATSPAGQAGWYIYGAKDRSGQFTVEGMQPRSLLQIQPQQTILGLTPGLKYIDFENWKNESDRKGKIQTVLLDAAATDPQASIAAWRVGDRFLVVHLYGGRGGSQKSAEKFVFGTYAGHFSFGVGEVIQDPFTKEPIFDYSYLQVYGNNGDGTMSGGNTWANYMGNLRRGIVGTRPVSDVLIKLDVLTEDYNFGGTKLSFFNELLAELSLIGARYRIGDGTGDSTITSATSCVQDSSQAVFLTLQRFRKKIETNPQIVQWMKDHPTAPDTQRFRRLVGVAKDLAAELTPMGVVRWDWEDNAEVLTGVRPKQSFISIDNFQLKNLVTGLISWRTAMPRQAHDEYAMLFLNHNAKLWFLRPNIIGGNDPLLSPLEPTLLFGAWKVPFTNFPLLSYLVIRTFGGVTIPDGWDWLLTGAILLSFGAVMFAIGVSQGFLYWHPWQAPWYRQLGSWLKLLFLPALWQEYVFRVLLIPYPKDWIPEPIWWAWAFLALGIFVGGHWLYARSSRKTGYATIANPAAWILLTLLGLACTVTYRFTGSLWTITVLHWLVVSIWWLLLGGKQRFTDKRDRWRVSR